MTIARAARVAKRRWVKLTENQWEDHPTQHEGDP